MQKEQIEIKLAEGTQEVIIRHGDAAPIELPNSVTLEGNIQSPTEFWLKRKDQLDIKNTHVLVSTKGNSIKLVTDEQGGRGFKVTGKLTINQHLIELGINTDKTFGIKELQKALKFRRNLFSDQQEFVAMLAALADFTLKSEVNAKAADDRRGNVNNTFQRTSQLNAPMQFDLHLPVYNGTEPKQFRVEVFADVRDAGVSFYLESIELAELLETVRDVVFAEQLALLQELVIITD